MQRILLPLLLLAAAIGVAACGADGAPERPGAADAAPVPLAGGA